MPIYEFQCGQCGEIMESWQKRNDPPPATCPSCGAEGAMGRVISQTSFHLKGGGWYVTDYKGSKTSSSGASSGGEDATAPSGDTSSASSASSADTSSASPASAPAADSSAPSAPSTGATTGS